MSLGPLFTLVLVDFNVALSRSLVEIQYVSATCT